MELMVQNYIHNSSTQRLVSSWTPFCNGFQILSFFVYNNL